MIDVQSQVTVIDRWCPVTVSLADFNGWVGGSSSAFADALNDVQWIDVQITRNGTASQLYYLDNFTRIDNRTTIVPDAGTGVSWATAFAWLALLGFFPRIKKYALD